jgi:amidase
VLLGRAMPSPRPQRVLIAEDLFAAAGADVTKVLQPSVDWVTSVFGPADCINVAEGGLSAWRNAFRLIQSSEAWAAHRDWIGRVRPEFGPGVRERFAAAATLDENEIGAAQVLRAAIRTRMETLLDHGAVLLLPTAPGIAPLRFAPEPELDAFRARALELLCPAGHAGLPQVSLPFGTLDGCPIGLSIMATRGRDELLLELAQACWPQAHRVARDDS